MRSASFAGSAAGGPGAQNLRRASVPPDASPAGKRPGHEAAPSTPARGIAPHPADEPGGGPGDTPAKSILLVEDDELLRGAVKMVLEWEGYQVDCAGDGREALDYLRGGARPSLILLDVMLPGMDGQQFREEQRRDPALLGVPVVVISALDAADCPDADAHVRKPFAVEELLRAVRGQGRGPAISA